MAWRIVGVAALTAGLCASFHPIASSLASILPVGANPRLVAGDNVAVMDAQTLRVEGRVVRLKGLAAPKAVAGPAALQLAALVRDQLVRCQIDTARSDGDAAAQCVAGGTNLNRALVAGGWAEARADAPGLKDAEMFARARHLGVWASR